MTTASHHSRLLIVVVGMIVSLASCSSAFAAPARVPWKLLGGEGDELFGCAAGDGGSVEVLRWDGSLFVVTPSPPAGIAQRCVTLADDRAEKPPTGAPLTQMVSDTRWAEHNFAPLENYQPTFVQESESGHVAVSLCRVGVRQAGDYCYLDISADGTTWIEHQQVGVVVELVTEHGVLVGSPASYLASDRTFYLYGYDGSSHELFVGLSPASVVEVMEDRVVKVEIEGSNASLLSVEQIFLP